MTSEGIQALQKKLEHLQMELIPELERRLGEAREKGDLSENAEYDAARERLWEAESQKGELEELLANSFEVEDPTEDSDTVRFGYVIEVRNLSKDEVERYRIVGVGEADLEKNKISYASPFAQAFINKKVGETVNVQVPAGTFEYRVEAVRRP